MIDLRRIRNDILALALLAATVFVALALFSHDPSDPPSTLTWPTAAKASNLCGTPGAVLSYYLFTYCGLGAWLLLVFLVMSDLRLFADRSLGGWFSRFFGMTIAAVAACVALQLYSPMSAESALAGSGGYIGAWGEHFITKKFAPTGAMILLASTGAAGLVLTGDVGLMIGLVAAVFAPLHFCRKLLASRRKKKKPKIKEDDPLAWEADRIPINAPPAPRINQPRAPEVAPEPRPTEDRSLTEDETVGIESQQERDPEPPPRIAEPVNVKPVGFEDGKPPFDDDPEPAELPINAPSAVRVNPPATGMSDRDRALARLDAVSQNSLIGSVALPDTALLEEAEDFPYELLANKARIAAETLERTFTEFGLNIRVVEVDTGPVITQFELALEPGLRVNKVSALADDLAIALRVPSVRVVPSIPGKNTVGVEVPNEKQVMVRLRELIESSDEQRDKHRVPIFVGKDVSGRPLTVDLTKMPHLLIAGRTGTGKSVCLNTLILSILMTRTPDEVKMLMIDPKMVELSPYKRVPHLMHPVITDMKKAEAVLAWAVDKMEERYDLLARCGVRHLDAYNKLGKDAVLDRLGLDANDPEDMLEAEGVPEKMPYIVIIADEMADMMMTSGKDVEGHIIRLAQKSRAVGIHLVLATQKPTVDVITGLIKSNLPARISFQVASRTDSRVVLDEMGAERLLGCGDMLYLAPGTSHVTRAQGAFVSDDEVNSVIDFYSAYEPQYSTELAKLKPAGALANREGGPGGPDPRDDLYEEAVEIVIREQLGSVSRLQRFLGIGYGRAARLVDYMAEDGIVGDYNGSKAREVLFTMEEWEALKGSGELSEA